MQIITSISEIRIILKSHNSIGFVPTMGALHKGHLSLVQKAKTQNETVVVSIFVNPTQFNNKTDLDKYPRNLSQDVDFLQSVGVDYIFAPTTNEMYPDEHIITYNAGYLDTIMEGATRSGHFSGVVQIVAKLFNVVKPTRAYFGQKDLQQLILIRRMTKELCFDITIITCEIIREPSGLAMSSRNRRLSESEKEVAIHLSKILFECEKSVSSGVSVKKTLEQAKNVISKNNQIKLEYLAVADAEYLSPVQEPSKQIAFCIAAFVGGVRLIDNVLVELN